MQWNKIFLKQNWAGKKGYCINIMKMNSNKIYQKQMLLHQVDELSPYFTVCTML